MFDCARALVVAAHPDDEVLGPGGTVRRLVDQRTEVLAVIACHGRPSLQDEMREAAAQAREVLGITETVFLGLPNLQASAEPLVEISSRLEAVIKDFGPRLLLTHHDGDLNQDHGVIFDAAMVASRPLQKNPVRHVLAFETPSSTEWREGDAHRCFHPNVYMEIGKTLETKIKALRCYRKEMRHYPHPRSFEGVRILARYRGMQAGLEHAEAFRLVRGIYT